MFSSAHRETHLVRLRAELAATREEALRLHSEFHQAASSERPGAELAAAAVPEEHPRLRQDVALLRSWIDHRRPSDIKGLLQGRRYLLDEYVYIGNGKTTSQTPLVYATRMKYHDVVAVLQEVAGDGSDRC